MIVPEEPREKLYCGCNALCGVSQAMCQAGAAIQQLPLYQHIAQLRFDKVQHTYNHNNTHPERGGGALH